jgi:hypothetical protein
MADESRCFKVNLSSIEAIVFVDVEEKKIKASCSNYEYCYYSKILNRGECPKYCEVISELRKYLFRGREPKAEITEIKLSAPKLREVMDFKESDLAEL